LNKLNTLENTEEFLSQTKEVPRGCSKIEESIKEIIEADIPFPALISMLRL
jgi:hypothetical protein